MGCSALVKSKLQLLRIQLHTVCELANLGPAVVQSNRAGETVFV